MSAETRDWTHAEYHADFSAISHSALDTFIADPALYCGRYVSGEFPFETSEAMDIGTVAHRILIEMDLADDGVVIIPDCVLTSNGQKRGKAWEEFAVENAGKILLTADKMALVLRLRDAVLANKTARWLLERPHGVNEQTILFDCGLTGMKLKARPDIRLPNDELIVDLKTAVASTPKAFANSVYRYGYHRQADFYKRGVDLLDPGKTYRTAFIVVAKEPPYRCRVMDLDAAALDVARQENDDALLELERCRADGIWDVRDEEGKPCGDDVITLGLPRWAKYEHEFSYTG